MTREQLIAQAEQAGIPRPRVLTQPELIDELIGRSTKGERERAKARGWLGRARDLLANVVEKGLHLPEAARVLRQEDKTWPAPPPPLPTVTLAEIYAAQGHPERALAVLDEVLAREPSHREARTLRERFVEQANRTRSRAGRERETPPVAKESAPPVTKESAAAREPTRNKPAVTAPVKAEPAVQPPPAEAAKPEAKRVAVDAERVTVEARPASPVAPPPALAVAPPAAAEPQPQGPTPVTAESELAAASTERAPALTPALEEPPLPQRYEVDEVVAIAVDPRTIYLYWEVRPTTLSQTRARRPDGALCVRLASVTASWEGPVVHTRDLHVDALYGDRFVRDVQPGSNVRVSVGWKSADGFEPFAVGADVMAPRMVPVESVSQEVARWEAEPVAPFSAWHAEGPAHREEAPRATRSPVLVERVGASASPGGSGDRGGRGGPVDTGVESWSDGEDVLDLQVVQPGEEVPEGEQIVEAPWFQPGGASELGRGAPGRVLAWRRRRGPGGPGRPNRLGGASGFGGASELGRS